ncbi:transcriptional regulator [Deinococcus sp.]|uniref:transcriptional regulator n=1 Tax=Deinococcus sp. TaxID=47478 RepID=UPI003CC6043A
MTRPESPPDSLSAGPQVAVLMYPGVSELEVGLLLGLLLHLNQEGSPASSDAAALTVARTRGSLVCAGGLVSTPHLNYAATPPLAGLLIPSGLGAQRAGRDAATRAFVRAQAARGVPVGACGSGVLLAGEAGLLAGRVIGVAPELVETAWGYLPADVQGGQVVGDEPGATAFRLFSGPGQLAALRVALKLAACVWPSERVAAAAGRIGAEGSE